MKNSYRPVEKKTKADHDKSQGKGDLSKQDDDQLFALFQKWNGTEQAAAGQ